MHKFLIRYLQWSMVAVLLCCAGTASGQVVFIKKSLSTEAAEQMTNSCLEWYKDHKVNGKPSIWVLDANGEIIYMKRVDGANRVGIETGRMKAESALYLFRSTRAISNFAKTPAGTPNPSGEALLVLLHGYSSVGGLPIFVEGQLVGSIGVGGMAPDAANGIYPDEQCAQAGIDAVFKK